MRIIDLTHTFEGTMPSYPGDPVPSLKKILKDECMDHALSTTMHIGTHMDAPLHMIAKGSYLSDIPADRFVGRGVLIDARGQDALSVDLLEKSDVREGDIVLLYTGHGETFHEKTYYAHYPLCTEDFAEEIVRRKVKIVGMDTASPDASPFPVHKILLGIGILIIANLCNLKALLDCGAFTVAALPMKLKSDAGPVRVVAIQE